MTEINIERKRGSVWAWLIPLILIGLAIWWLVGRDWSNDFAVGDRGDAVVDTAAGTVAATGAAAGYGDAGTVVDGSVDEFAAFISNSEPNRSEDEQHEYTAEGLRRLAAALASRVPSAEHEEHLALIRAKADSLQMSPTGSDRHAEMTQSAMTAAAIIFGDMPGIEDASASALRRAAVDVNVGGDLLAQQNEIQEFFNLALDALR